MKNFFKKLFSTHFHLHLRKSEPFETYSAFPSLKEHEKHGETICPECDKKFIASIMFCTRDVVFKFDKPERLCTTEAYCPHCNHAFELGYTPISTVLNKLS